LEKLSPNRHKTPNPKWVNKVVPNPIPEEGYNPGTPNRRDLGTLPTTPGE